MPVRAKANDDYKQSYESQDNKERVYDDNLTSFMGKRGAEADAVTNEDDARRAGINNAVNNLKVKLKNVNDDSKTAAGEFGLGIAHTVNDIVKIINGAKAARIGEDGYADRIAGKIEEKARKWNDKRQKYYDGKFMEFYNKYDNLATTYYIMSRQARAAAGGASGLNATQQKRIVEPVQVVDTDRASIINATRLIKANPGNTTSQVVKERFVKLRKKTGSDEVVKGEMITDAAQNKYKLHKKITMKGKGDNNEIIRYKLKADNFAGKMAKRQYSADEGSKHDELKSDETKKNLVARDVGADEEEQNADTMNLLSDAMAANDTKLYAAENAQLVQDEDGNDGYYINGEFVSASANNATAKIGDKKTADEEVEVRTAIRSNRFFDHVNSTTIQKYMTYDGDNERGAFDEQMAAVKTSTAANDQGLRSALEYVHNIYIDHADGQPDEADINHASITALGKDEQKKVAMYLLSKDNKARAWEFAKDIVTTYIGDYAEQRLEMLNGASGEIMRMSLFEELGKNRSRRGKYGADILGAANMNNPLEDEDLKDKRGGFWLQLKQSWADGSLTKDINSAAKVAGAVSTWGSAVTSMKNDSTDTNFFDDMDNWTTLVSECTDFIDSTGAANNYAGLAATAGAGIAAGKMGKDRADGEDGKDIFKQLKEKNGAVNNVLKIKYLFKIVKQAIGAYEGYCKLKDLKKKKEALSADATKPKDRYLDSNHSLRIDLTNKIIEILSLAVKLADSFIEQDKRVGADGKEEKFDGTAKNILNYVNDGLSVLKSTLSIVKARIENSSYSELIDRSKQTLTELADRTADAGLADAADENKQGQFLLAMSKSSARKKLHMNRWDYVTNAVSALSSGADAVVRGFGKSSVGKTLSSGLSSLGINISGKTMEGIAKKLPKLISGIGSVISFTKSMVSRFAYDQNKEASKIIFKNEKIYKKSSFDRILKEETGIQSKRYLGDLSKIFSAIDTHAMIRKPDIGGNDLKLAKKLMSNYFGNISNNDNDAKAQMKKIKLADIIKHTGYSGNWRTLLKNSVTS